MRRTTLASVVIAAALVSASATRAQDTEQDSHTGLYYAYQDQWLIRTANFWNEIGRPADFWSDSEAANVICESWQSRAEERNERVRIVFRRDALQSAVNVMAMGVYGVYAVPTESLELRAQFRVVDDFCDAQT